jgi:hypothetical protein
VSRLQVTRLAEFSFDKNFDNELFIIIFWFDHCNLFLRATSCPVATITSSPFNSPTKKTWPSEIGSHSDERISSKDKEISDSTLHDNL